MRHLVNSTWIIFGAICILLGSAFLDATVWGFFGHRRINRMAVFTVPAELIPLYKKNIEYITEHAVDPDKRRYATKHEAVRHYIDIDHWGDQPFKTVPRDFTDALIKFGQLWQIQSITKDSILLFDDQTLIIEDGLLKSEKLNIDYQDFRAFFDEVIMPQYYEDEKKADANQLNEYCPGAVDPEKGDLVFVDDFSGYGILPYHLERMQKRLTDAFFESDLNEVVRLSADIGHYISDAHVPLHTTENYNGQLTNQEGIHAFWESRLPELFADDQYDFLVGRAEYITDVKSYYWDVVESAHQLLDSVLLIERSLSQTFPTDLQYCYEDRLDYTVRTQCEEYSEAYHQRLSGMVEQQMRKSIYAVGSAWYTAWVNAGQPDIQEMMHPIQLSEQEKKELDRQEQLYRQGNIKGRKHDQ